MVYMGSTPRVGLTHGLRRLLVLALLALCSAHTAPAGGDCAASDASMLHARKMLCNSLVQGHTAWCKDDWQNVSASKDWPSQAVYMVDVLDALLAAPSAISCRCSSAACSAVGGAALLSSPNFQGTWQISHSSRWPCCCHRTRHGK